MYSCFPEDLLPYIEYWLFHIWIDTGLGVVRDLMQEQFIDELVFKCLTLEDDLGRAVARLKTQPGQFAGKCSINRHYNSY